MIRKILCKAGVHLMRESRTFARFRFCDCGKKKQRKRPSRGLLNGYWYDI